MNSLSAQTLKEIVDFINETQFKTDINLFERLNSEELLNIYIYSLIYLGFADNFDEFELNEEEESLFATVVRENKTLKIIKVTAFMNHLFQKFGYVQNFSPIYILSPTLDETQTNLLKLLEIKKKISEYNNKYKEITKDYLNIIGICNGLPEMINKEKQKNNELYKILEEGNKITNEIKNNIDNYSKQINELNPLLHNNKENIAKLNDELNNKNIQLEQISKEIEENSLTLSKLKEGVVPDPQKFNQIIEDNKKKLETEQETQKNLLNELDILYKNNETCLKIFEKLQKLQKEVEEYHDYDMKNKELMMKKEGTQNDIKELENEIIECKSKYGKNLEILKNTELLLKNKQNDFNNLKNDLFNQIKKNEQDKNDLKVTLEHINEDIKKYKSEIDTINLERNELNNIRNEYANVLGEKFKDIIKRRNIYFKLLDKSLEIYQNYDLLQNKNK